MHLVPTEPAVRVSNGRGFWLYRRLRKGRRQDAQSLVDIKVVPVIDRANDGELLKFEVGANGTATKLTAGSYYRGSKALAEPAHLRGSYNPALWCEVAIRINHHVGRIRDIHVDRSAGSDGDQGRICNYDTFLAIQRGYSWLRLTCRPGGQKP